MPENPVRLLKFSSLPYALMRYSVIESMVLMLVRPLASPLLSGAEGKGKPAVFYCRIKLML